MKKLSWFLIVLLAATLPAYAKEDKGASNFSVSKKLSVSAATSAPATPVAMDAKRAEMKKKVEEKKKDLNGSEWKVALTSGAKPDGEDILTFQNGQVASKMFGDKGFPASNYTITVPEGADMATWETMQTNTKGGVLFIRGEGKEGVMRGVMSQQLEEGKTKDYNFSSAAKVAVSPTTKKKDEPNEEAAVPAVLSTPAEQAQTTAESEVVAFAPGTTDEKS